MQLSWWKGGYKCRILIDKNSENLELGKQVLSVDDISRRSGFGTDLIFKLKMSAEAKKEAGVVTLKAPKNKILIKKCKELGGEWSWKSKVWVFSGIYKDEVENLKKIYNSEPVEVEILFKRIQIGWKDAVYFLGVPIAAAEHRDSGAEFCEGVTLIEGGCYSGGSRQNWQTIIEPGTVLKAMIPSKLIEKGFKHDEIEMKKL